MNIKGKAVICAIAKPEDMPIDADGNRADIVMDPNSTISRMNIGRFYEQYYNACSRDIIKRLRVMLNIPKENHHPIGGLTQLHQDNIHLFNQTYDYLIGYYKIVSPKMFNHYVNMPDEKRIEHLNSIFKDFIYLYLPTDNSPELPDVISQLEASYKPTYSPVTYTGYSGKQVTTKRNVRIGSVYMMLLEKIGDDWSSTSSGKIHHFGFLAPVNKSDKFAKPYRPQPVRVVGEAEARILASYCGPRATAEIMDRNGAPTSHKTIVENILKANKPTNIDNVVDRQLVPLGKSKPIQLIDHVMFCAGIKFSYLPNKK